MRKKREHNDFLFLCSPFQYVCKFAPHFLGDRLMAGHQTLTLSIGVQIPVPQRDDLEIDK